MWAVHCSFILHLFCLSGRIEAQQISAPEAGAASALASGLTNELGSEATPKAVGIQAGRTTISRPDAANNIIPPPTSDPSGNQEEVTSASLPPLATPCNKTACRTPLCYCDSFVIPGGLASNDTPQMVITAFDGAVNMHNYVLYTEMYHNERTNPNVLKDGGFYRTVPFVGKTCTLGWSSTSYHCSIGEAKDLLTGDEANATYEDFTEDIVAFQQIAKNFADVAVEDIVGMRAPYLKTEGDDQFLAAFDAKLLYDTSILNPTTKPVWPFTLDYAMPFQCPEWYPPCPMLSYPGLWEIPVTRMVGPTGIPYGFYTAYEFSKNPVEVADTLMKAFKTHYESNRAPFTLNGLSYWFGTAEYRLGFELFLEQILRLPDVWIVTASQVISWMQQPTPTSRLQDFEPFKCTSHRDVQVCPVSRNCRTFLDGEEIYFSTCKHCPFTFPYLKNYNGCFNDPCPTPIVEYVDDSTSVASSVGVILLAMLAYFCQRTA